MSQDRVLRCPMCGRSGEKVIKEIAGVIEIPNGSAYPRISYECEACGHEW